MMNGYQKTFHRKFKKTNNKYLMNIVYHMKTDKYNKKKKKQKKFNMKMILRKKAMRLEVYLQKL